MVAILVVSAADISLSNVPLSDVSLPYVSLSDIPLAYVSLADIALTDIPLADISLTYITLSNITMAFVASSPGWTTMTVPFIRWATKVTSIMLSPSTTTIPAVSILSTLSVVIHSGSTASVTPSILLGWSDHPWTSTHGLMVEPTSGLRWHISSTTALHSYKLS